MNRLARNEQFEDYLASNGNSRGYNALTNLDIETLITPTTDLETANGSTNGHTEMRLTGDASTGKFGVSVIGVSNIQELEKTLRTWRCILNGLSKPKVSGLLGREEWIYAKEWSQNRSEAMELLADGVRGVMGKWVDYTWNSPPDEFVNRLGEEKSGRVT